MTFVFLLLRWREKKHKQNKCKSNIYTSRVEKR